MSFRIITASSATFCFSLRKRKTVPSNPYQNQMSWSRTNSSLSETKNNQSMRFEAPMFQCSAGCRRTYGTAAVPRRLTCKQITALNRNCSTFLTAYLCESFIRKLISPLAAQCLRLRRNLSPSSAERRSPICCLKRIFYLSTKNAFRKESTLIRPSSNRLNAKRIRLRKK